MPLQLIMIMHSSLLCLLLCLLLWVFRRWLLSSLLLAPAQLPQPQIPPSLLLLLLLPPLPPSSLPLLLLLLLPCTLLPASSCNPFLLLLSQSLLPPAPILLQPFLLHMVNSIPTLHLRTMPCGLPHLLLCLLALLRRLLLATRVAAPRLNFQ